MRVACTRTSFESEWQIMRWNDDCQALREVPAFFCSGIDCKNQSWFLLVRSRCYSSSDIKKKATDPERGKRNHVALWRYFDLCEYNGHFGNGKEHASTSGTSCTTYLFLFYYYFFFNKKNLLYIYVLTPHKVNLSQINLTKLHRSKLI